MAGPSRINVVTVFLWIFVVGGAYTTFRYVPIYWTKLKLEDLVKEECYASRAKPEDRVAEAIVGAAQRRLSVELIPEDVEVVRMPDRILANVIWRLVVDHPFNYVSTHVFRIRREVVFY